MSFYNKSSTVVKLAVVGDVPGDVPEDDGIPEYLKDDAGGPGGFMSFGMGAGGIYAPFKGFAKSLIVPSDQISKFEYTLFGENSYKFSIELVNYSDTLLTSITKAVAKGLPGVDTLDYTKQDLGIPSEFKSLPKLLIQWGYEDLDGISALSTIHTAAITTVDYKFSQGREKILIINAVFVGDEALQTSATDNSTLYVDLDMPMKCKRDEAPQIFINRHDSEDHLSIGDIVRDAVTKLLSNLDGFKVISTESGEEQHDREIAQLQEALVPRMQVELDEEGNELKESDATDDTFEDLDSVEFHSEKLTKQVGGYRDGTRVIGTLDAYINRATKDDDIEAHYWKTLEAIFTFIGFEITRPGKEDILRALAETSAKVDAQLPGVEYIPPPDTPEDHDFGSTAFPNPFDSPISTDETLKAGEEKTKVYSFIIDQTCGEPLRTNIQQKFFPDITAPTFEWTVKNVSPRTIHDGSREFSVLALSKDITSVHDIVENNQQDNNPLRGRIIFDNIIKIEGSSYVTVDNYITSVDAGCQKSLQTNTDVENVRSNQKREELARKNADKVRDKNTFTKMSVAEQREFVLENIKITAVSQENEAVLTTAKKIISQYNAFATGGWSSLYYSLEYLETPELDLYIEGVTYDDQDFSEVLKEKSKNPKDMRTTLCRIGHKSDVEKERKSILRTSAGIKSSDIEFSTALISPKGLAKMEVERNESETIPEIINLSYGYPDSIVKFFDFKGDIRILRNITTAVANTVNLTGVHTHLQAKQIRKGFIPIVDMLLGDEDFMAAMEKAPRDDEKLSAVEVLNALKLIVANPPVGAGFIRPPKDLRLDNLSYVRDYLVNRPSNKDLSLNFNGDFEDSMSTFNLFLAAMLDIESIKLLMDTSSIGGADRYILKTKNSFDLRADNTRGDAHNTALQTYANGLNMFSEVRLKTLGIPEISRLVDVTNRGVYFTVSDPSETNPKRLHWLTGLYRIIALTHLISPSEGYSSEFKLIKVPV